MLINNDINHYQKNKDNMTPLELAQIKNSDIYAYLSKLLAEKEKKNVKCEEKKKAKKTKKLYVCVDY